MEQRQIDARPPFGSCHIACEPDRLLEVDSAAIALLLASIEVHFDHRVERTDVVA